MSLNLENKNIVVTGATKGVGKELVKQLIEEGANVVLSGRDEHAIKDLISEANQSKVRALFVKTELENVEDCKALFIEAEKQFGAIDGLVNYAGITPITSLTDCTEEIYNQVMNVNLRAPFFCTQMAVKNMLKFKRAGSIVQVGSSHAWSGEKDRAPYAISKGGLLTLSEHISHNYASYGIRSNYLTMGWTATDGELQLRNENGMSKKDLEQSAAKSIPMKKMIEYDDLIPGIKYLLSDGSKMVTGSNLRITGGQYI